jgi:hypothetical protein
LATRCLMSKRALHCRSTRRCRPHFVKESHINMSSNRVRNETLVARK